MIDPKQFERGSDFRGDHPRQVNEELAYFVGRYLVRFLREIKAAEVPKVVVGRDGRLSSPAVYAALIHGVAAEGGTPVPAGLAPTDAVCWAAGARLYGADAGVMITASHNPPEYNGIKIVRPHKSAALPGLAIIRPTELRKYFDADLSSQRPDAVIDSVAPYPATPLSVVSDFLPHARRWAADRAEFTGTG